MGTASRKKLAPSSLALAAMAVTLAIALALPAVSRLLPASPTTVKLSASVHNTGDVSVLFANKPGDATSPVCGCVHHDPPGGWRGIVLPAQDLVMGRRSPKSATLYEVSSTAPQQLGALPQRYGLRQRVAIIAVPRSKVGVNPLRLPHRDVLVNSGSPAVVTDWLGIVVSGDLHVHSMSSEPVAAFSPPMGRVTTIHYGDPGDESSHASLQIRTSFNARASERTGDDVNGTPVVDVLGPRMLLWGPIAGVKHPVTYWAWGDPVVDRPGARFENYAADWSEPTPPRPPAGWVPEVVVLTYPPLFAARLAIKPTRLDDRTDEQPSPTRGSGEVFVSVTDVERSAAALLPKFRRADEHPTFAIHDLPTIPTTAEASTRNVSDGPGSIGYVKTAWLEEEYPPTPPRTGINIFGPVRALRFSAAAVDLTVGDKPSTYRALTPFELDNIHGAGVLGRHMLVPIRIYGRGASIHVVGSADARVNGLPLTTRRPWIARLLGQDSVGWFLGVAGAVLSLISALLWRRVRTA